MNRQRERETYIIDWTQLRDKYIAALDPHTGNDFFLLSIKYYFRDYTEKPFDCACMLCAQLRLCALIAKKCRKQPDRDTK